MSTGVRRLHYTYAEYVSLEDESAVRHEYLDGEIYAMAAGTPDHAALAAAVIRVLAGAVRPPCRPFTSDRGEKLRHYQQLPSVREVLFVSHRGARLTLHRREDDGGWSVHEAGAGDVLELVSVVARVAVDELYAEPLEDVC